MAVTCYAVVWLFAAAITLGVRATWRRLHREPRIPSARVVRL